MQSNELLLTANQHAHTLTMPLIEDLRTAHFVSPAPGGHHGHWVVGRLLFSEGRFQQIMQGATMFLKTCNPALEGSQFRVLMRAALRMAALQSCR